MAAPDTPTNLSVVDETQTPETAPSTPSPDQPVSGESHSAASPAGASNDTESPPRRGAPWWLVGVVAVVGVLLFGQQYQRAAGFEARVTSLTEELLVADQRLQIAQGQISAHQTHLDRVRLGVAELTLSVAGLQTLANEDPLSPPASVAKTEGSSPLASESGETVSEPLGSDNTSHSLTTDAVPSEPLQKSTESSGTGGVPAGDSRSIVHEIIGTPFSDL